MSCKADFTFFAAPDTVIFNISLCSSRSTPSTTGLLQPTRTQSVRAAPWVSGQPECWLWSPPFFTLLWHNVGLPKCGMSSPINHRLKKPSVNTPSEDPPCYLPYPVCVGFPSGSQPILGAWSSCQWRKFIPTKGVTAKISFSQSVRACRELINFFMRLDFFPLLFCGRLSICRRVN